MGTLCSTTGHTCWRNRQSASRLSSLSLLTPTTFIGQAFVLQQIISPWLSFPLSITPASILINTPTQMARLEHSRPTEKPSKPGKRQSKDSLKNHRETKTECEKQNTHPPPRIKRYIQKLSPISKIMSNTDVKMLGKEHNNTQSSRSPQMLYRIPQYALVFQNS